MFCALGCSCDGFFATPHAAKTASAVARDAALPAQGSDGRYVCDDKIYPAASDARRLTKRQYQNAVRDIFDGRVAASDVYPSSYGAPNTGYSTEPAVNGVGEQDAEALMLASEEVAERIATNAAALLPCAAQASPDAACAGAFIDKYARRAYRRPVASEERALLLKSYSEGRASGASFTEALAMLSVNLLQSAPFLYAAEWSAGDQRALDGYEIGARLAFLLWDSVPDDALLDKAATLGDKAVLAAEANRLLADPRADSALSRFFREWSQTEELSSADKDAAAFPYFDDAFAASMNASFDRFVVGVMRDGGTLSALLTDRSVYVDARLAGFFSVPAPASGFAKVALDPAIYSGMLTQPAMLASLAHSTEPSYVFRGRFIRKRLLCDVLGLPPGNAMAEFAEIEKPANPTAKDLSAAVRARSQCTSCHSLMDPAGLAFERFDGAGHYRQSYANGKAIDPSGTLDAVGTQQLVFSDHVALLGQLAAEPRVAECFAKQVFRFSLSREETAADVCALQAVSDALAASGGGLASAWLALVTSDAFLNRRDP